MKDGPAWCTPSLIRKPVSLPPHEGLHLRHVRLLDLAVQIAVTRARSLVDQGQTQLAADYIRAFLDGAIAAVTVTPPIDIAVRPA